MPSEDTRRCRITTHSSVTAVGTKMAKNFVLVPIRFLGGAMMPLGGVDFLPGVRVVRMCRRRGEKMFNKWLEIHPPKMAILFHILTILLNRRYNRVH